MDVSQACADHLNTWDANLSVAAGEWSQRAEYRGMVKSKEYGSTIYHNIGVKLDRDCVIWTVNGPQSIAVVDRRALRRKRVNIIVAGGGLSYHRKSETIRLILRVTDIEVVSSGESPPFEVARALLTHKRGLSDGSRTDPAPKRTRCSYAK